MTAQLIDGKAIAQQIRSSVKERVAQRIEEGKRAPGLAVVLVGSDPASQVNPWCGLGSAHCGDDTSLWTHGDGQKTSHLILTSI